MKKIIPLIACIAFLGCAKSIDIEYSEPKINNVENFLVGTWDGLMNCSSCCSYNAFY